jgi:DNA-binding XRE family transcriptional regulator
MSVHTRTVRTKSKAVKRPTKLASKRKGIPWREAFKKEIAKYGEGGLMLRGSRAKEEVTQKELADALGISQHHISEMENGKRPIEKEMAKRLAEYFKTDYRVFL